MTFIFRAKIVGGEISPREGEIADHRFFAPREIEQLVEEGKLYQPKYNIAGIRDWLAGCSYSLDAVKPLSG